jgi:2-dehydro-3-deoxyphosphooctonate aldolase (KDO 8-P synthase)
MSQFFLIAGPCVIESRDHCMKMAKEIKEITTKLGIHYIFKASFDKANRTSSKTFRGQGIDEGIKILEEVRNTYGIPILTDIHSVEQVEKVANVVDVIQIPAFLCRQTDLLVAVGRAIAGTNKAVNIKKGQFCNDITMKHAYNKMYEAIEDRRKEMDDEGVRIKLDTHYFWDNQIWLCDRGSMYGYDDLVVDMRGLVKMRDQGKLKDNSDKSVMIVQDATHALQQPNRAGTTLGQRYLIPTIARSAVATGVHGLFMEVHDDPHKALSDATTQWPLHQLEPLLVELQAISRVTRGLETNYIADDY